MPKKLPEPFVDKMRTLLGSEFDDFLASYDQSRHYGLRVNPLKIGNDEFEAISPFTLKPVAWAAEGYYYGWGDRPGKHPYYHAGLYYIQEPSAMAPAELLQVKPGDRVLDLCAAPGGKSTQIAGKLQGRGLLVSNDNQAERVKALVKNLAIFGARNAIVTNETPEKLTRVFPHFFDKIVIDAPCSGEGMFRKDQDMVASWESHSVDQCALLQRDILAAAARLLAPGGRIVYSTCTFAPEENEATIARFLDQHPDFTVAPESDFTGFSPGRPAWINGEQWSTGEVYSESSTQAVSGTYRLWPHLIDGEGHYAAVLMHKGDPARAQRDSGADARHNDDIGDRNSSKIIQASGQPGKKRKAAHAPARQQSTNDLGIWFDFMAQHLAKPIEGRWICYGDRVYWSDMDLPDLTGLSVARPGWFVGTLKKNRFVPSQALALGLRMEDAARSIRFSADDADTIRYLRGDTLQLPEERLVKRSPDTPSKGYCLIGVDGFPLGWAKWQDGMLKNEYPPGWRWT